MWTFSTRLWAVSTVEPFVKCALFPGEASGKEPTWQCRRHKRCKFDPWVGKIPWRRAWQPTLLFLPGESQGQRSLAGYSPWGCKESDTTEATEHTHMQTNKEGRCSWTSTLKVRSWLGPIFGRILTWWALLTRTITRFVETLFMSNSGAGAAKGRSRSQGSQVQAEVLLITWGPHIACLKQVDRWISRHKSPKYAYASLWQ